MSQLLEIERDGVPHSQADPRRTRGGTTSVYIETYGCQMNLSDTELMFGVLKVAGFRIAGRPEDADVVLLNTCAIREHAEERVIGRLNQLSHLKVRRPGLVMGVSGCMAKHLAEKMIDSAPSVDLVLGPDSYRRLPEMIEQAARGSAVDVRLDRDEDYLGLDPARPEGASAWITIMRGCDKFCTFCIVPYVRGRERSVPDKEVVRQVETAAAEGFREVTLLGQTVNSYRCGDVDFADLLRKVADVPGIERIRFTSPHPSDFTDKLIATMACLDKICKHAHLPVQSGSDRVLSAMKRNYTRSEFLDLVGRLQRAMPGLCMSTDIIAGFPGESEADLDDTLSLMRQVRFDFAFMFKYSARAGTAAFREMPDTVSEAEKTRRLEAVIALQNGISDEINRSYIGRSVEVLVQGDARKGAGMAAGRTDGFKSVVFPRGGAENHSFVTVQITDATQKTLIGCKENA